MPSAHRLAELECQFLTTDFRLKGLTLCKPVYVAILFAALSCPCDQRHATLSIAGSPLLSHPREYPAVGGMQTEGDCKDLTDILMSIMTMEIWKVPSIETGSEEPTLP